MSSPELSLTQFIGHSSPVLVGALIILGMDYFNPTSMAGPVPPLIVACMGFYALYFTHSKYGPDEL